METIFGLLIVGYVGYILISKLFSTTNSRNIDERLRALETDLWQLKTRLNKLEGVQIKGQATPFDEEPKVAKAEAEPADDQPTVPIYTYIAESGESNPHAAVFSVSADGETKEQLWTAAAETAGESGTAQGESAGARSNSSSSTPSPWQDYPDEPLPDFLIAAKNWLFGGNTLVRSGIVILFIGVSFLLKYAAEHTSIPIEVRMAAIEIFGIGLLALGWRMRNERTEYAWALQGGGIGILYLSTFAAYKLYQLLSPGATFAILILIALLSAAIAVLQSAMSMAILGFAGGFLAPVFTSTGHGSHIGLFSYYLVLNLAIAAIAYFQSWRGLNVLGFFFTFIIGTIWGAKSYVPEFFASTEPFLVIHFLLFNCIAILYAHRQSTKASDYVDSTLVFGTPIVGFGLQYALLEDSRFGLAYSAVVLGAFYIGLARWLFLRKRDTLEFLAECFLALGIGFATLAIPLALDGRWTSAAWAVEGVGLVWAGLRQERKLPLIAGLLLQLLGAGAFCMGWGLNGYAVTDHQNIFLGVAFIALSGWVCGALINAYRPGQFKLITSLLAVWGWFWWLGSGLTAIDQILPPRLFMHAALVFVAGTSAVLPSVAHKFNWSKLSNLTGFLLPVMAFATFIEFFKVHPCADYGAIGWVAAFAVYCWLLRRGNMPKGIVFRAPLLWLAALLGVKEWRYQMLEHINEALVWHDIGWAIVPASIVAGVCWWQKNRVLDNDGALQSAKTWLGFGCAPLMAFLLLWFVYASLSASGFAAPLPYIPLLNPLDVALTAILLLFLLWQRATATFSYALTQIAPALVGLMGFVLLNGMLLRTLHHWLGTPFEWVAIFTYPEVQMAFTFLWGISAFILMLLAHRRNQRQLWLVGAGLMALVVAKIFLLDLAQRGSIERIVSFIGAGVILLVMGYFAPIPPARQEAEQ